VFYDKSADHPVGMCVSGGACSSHLLHSRNGAARIRGADRSSSCSVAGAGRDRAVRKTELVAHTIGLDAILLAAFLSRACDLADANLPRQLAGGPPLRVARPGNLSLLRRGHWSTTGLLNRSDVSSVDGFRAGRCSHTRGCCDLRRYGGARTGCDASYCRPREPGSVGATPAAACLMNQYLCAVEILAGL